MIVLAFVGPRPVYWWSNCTVEVEIIAEALLGSLWSSMRDTFHSLPQRG
jgi:hypothetical protein